MTLQFDASDPFPLIPEGQYSYQEEQDHSAQVDAWLGLETEKIEKEIQSKRFEDEMGVAIKNHEQLWVGLPTEALLTPYTEIRRILDLLKPKPNTRLIDLGSGYGRIGFVIGRHYSEVDFVGYEYVQKRVEESKRCLARWNYARVAVEAVDLAEPDFMPAPADFYFLYDFGSKRTIEKVLQDLRSVARERPIAVIGRGRSVRDLIELGHPWLSSVHAPTHFKHYSLYRSAVDS
jgi:hypothetical protein